MERTQKFSNNGLDNFILNYTEALKENSQEIYEMLQVLKERELTDKDKKSLKSIKKDLKRLDSEIDRLGGK